MAAVVWNNHHSWKNHTATRRKECELKPKISVIFFEIVIVSYCYYYYYCYYYSALQRGSPYFHGLRLLSEPRRQRIMGLTVVSPRNRLAYCDATRSVVSTVDAPQRGQVELACLPTSMQPPERY